MAPRRPRLSDKTIEAQKERLRESYNWFPFAALLSFVLVAFLTSHVVFGTNPRIGNPAELLSFDEEVADPASVDVVPGEPSAADAVAVLRDYYAAIGARDYARAHALWSDGGRASGQTLEQFANGFANTASVVAEPGEPGRVEPAAGSRYIEVPVSITATRDDGSVRRYLGNYTLRRAVVDGASAEQRAWRIATADIREVTARSGN